MYQPKSRMLPPDLESQFVISREVMVNNLKRQQNMELQGLMLSNQPWRPAWRNAWKRKARP